MSDLVCSDGYAVCFDRKKNQIVIGLPPTARTATTTTQQIVKRREDMTDEDALLLLEMVKYIFKEVRHE